MSQNIFGFHQSGLFLCTLRFQLTCERCEEKVHMRRALVIQLLGGIYVESIKWDVETNLRSIDSDRSSDR